MGINILRKRVLHAIITMSCLYGGFVSTPLVEAGTPITSNTDVSWRFQTGTYDFADGLNYIFTDDKQAGIVINPLSPGNSSVSPTITLNALGTLKISGVNGISNASIGVFIHPGMSPNRHSLYGTGKNIYLTGEYTGNSASNQDVAGLKLDGDGIYNPSNNSNAYAQFNNENTYISAIANPTVETGGSFGAVKMDLGTEVIFNGNAYLDLQMNDKVSWNGTVLSSRVSHVEFNGDNTILKGSSASNKLNTTLYGAYLHGDYRGGLLYERTNQAKFTGKEVNIDVKSSGSSSVYGIYAQCGYADATNNVDNFTVTANAEGNNVNRIVNGIQAWNHETVDIQAKNIIISSSSEAEIPWYNNAALHSWTNGNINIGGKKAVITSSGTSNGGVALYSVGQASSLPLADGVTGNKGADITINAEDITITSNTNGDGERIVAYAWSIDSPATIHVNSDAVGLDQGKTVNVIGNIYAAGGGKDFFNFGNADSSFTGKTRYWVEKADGSEINMGLSNGALWNMTGTSYVTNLTDSAGVLDMHADEGKYSNLYVANLKGTGGTIIMDTDLQASGDAKDVGTKDTLSDKIYISNSSNGDFDIDVHDHSSKLADDGYLLLIVDSSVNPAATFKGKARIQNGGLFAYPGVITDVDPEGYANVPEGSKNWYLTLDKTPPTPPTPPTPTTNNDANIGFAENRYTALFDEQDNILQRLGELRDFPDANQGLWARYRHGNYSLDNYGGDSKYNTFQIGWDKKTKDNAEMKQYNGVAYHHTWGNNSFSGMDARGNSAKDVLTVYSSNMYNKGHYLDLVGKIGKYRGDFELKDYYPESGDTNSWLYSLSAEYGRKKMLGTKGWYMEPQAQLTWSHLGSSDYTSSQGTHGYLDAINSLVFRVGTTIGKHSGKLGVNGRESFGVEPFKGQTNFYGKIFWNHEFNGDYNYNFLDKNNATAFGNHDFGGSWWTVGVGFTHNLSEKTHMYVDLEKNFGGEIDKNWRVQAGLRWTWGGAKKVAPLVVEPVLETEPIVEPIKKTYLDSVHFDFDVDTPMTSEMHKIDHFVEVARENPEKKYAVVGNTDAIGTDEYNQDLSKRRADNVKAEAAKRGVPETQMQEGYLGKAKPVESNDTAKGRAANRRVDIYEHKIVR